MTRLAELDAVISCLEKRKPLPPLVPQDLWDKDLNQIIDKLEISECAKAALYLWNDDIESAHLIVQRDETATSCLIHAILHRREPDYGNSKYWLRRVGNHAIYDEIRKKYAGWEPVNFVDLCQKAARDTPGKLHASCMEIQTYELSCLTRFCLS